ncbi:acyl carrier protein [Streptomyces sp. NPDC057438]|uniref:acyl carrier protein n=1 Tax=Streptomyces sp. NPDC057438 TaxID=3346133 RepID=UPI00368A2694
MTTNDVLRALTPLIRARTEHPPAEPAAVTPETRLEQDLRMDSMAIVHVLEDIEDSYGVTIPDERLAAVYTVGDLVDIVRTTAEPGERVA